MEGYVMRKLSLLSAIISAMSALAGVAPVGAADLGPAYKTPLIAPAFNWNGFYAGVNLGGAWASDTVVQSNLARPFSNTKVTSSGVVGGGQLGFNWVAMPNWLLGIEADVSAADLNGSAIYNNRAQFNEKVDAFGTVRGRLGYVANNWLFYGTGGFAWSDDTFTRTQVLTVAGSPPLGDVRTNSPTRTGWAAGGGIEYGFARNWTARIEYLHLDLSDQTFSFTASSNVFRSIDEGRLTIDTVRVGVSYLFN
jgi:outer membrane immunogenic protein